MSPQIQPCNVWHIPQPDHTGVCKVCGWEVTSPKPDPETPAPVPGEELSLEWLESAHPGTRVADCQGDIWVKQSSGVWKWDKATLSSPSLYAIFGPIRLYEETE